VFVTWEMFADKPNFVGIFFVLSLTSTGARFYSTCVRIMMCTFSVHKYIWIHQGVYTSASSTTQVVFLAIISSYVISFCQKLGRRDMEKVGEIEKVAKTLLTPLGSASELQAECSGLF
jgi:hypothetical protein